MAAIQIRIRGQGNVPDAAVAEIRASVKALVQVCADAGAADLLRVDFAPAEDPIPLAAPPPAPPVPELPASPPLEAAVLERPQPMGRVKLPPTPKPPDAPTETTKEEVP